MSAFVVSRECIEQIVGAFMEYAQDEPSYDFYNLVANGLMVMNIESVNYRYNEKDKPEWREYAILPIGRSKTEIAKAIKQIACWQYQSCELPDYSKWWIWKYVNKELEKLLPVLLPQYGKRPTGDLDKDMETALRIPQIQDLEVWG